MTTPPPGEAGWMQRLENLARAQEESVDLTPGLVWTTEQLEIVRNLLAKAVKAEAAVRRVEALATTLANTSAVPIHRREAAERIRCAIDGGGDVNMPVQPLRAAVSDEQARTGARGSGRCEATEGDGE